MVETWQILLINFGPILLFIVLMLYVYRKGTKQNEKLLEETEQKIESSLSQRGISYEKVKIRPDEYEFRCDVKRNKSLRILTLHLKLVNRSFIIQWLINFIFKEKEKLFIGAKFSGEMGDEDPVYKFDIVPYIKKNYISRRFDYFVEMEDIPTIDGYVDKHFMVKSQSPSYVKHIVENKEIITLIKKHEENIEHIGMQSSKEATDPHFSATYNYHGLKDAPIHDFIRLFFLINDEHYKNHSSIKKLLAKGQKGKYQTRGSAKRGAKKQYKSK